MSSISTHVLDLATGRPAAGMGVRLEGAATGDVESVTDADGRVGALGEDLAAGRYTITFDTGGYGNDLYPEVVVAFRVEDDQHYHIPLLLSPHGYSTYRGT